MILKICLIKSSNKLFPSCANHMDKHFVPGLTLDPVTEKLERGDPSDGGIMVGVKTQYVPGIFMTEAGKDAYEKAALNGLSQKLQELMK